MTRSNIDFLIKIIETIKIVKKVKKHEKEYRNIRTDQKLFYRSIMWNSYFNRSFSVYSWKEFLGYAQIVCSKRRKY